MMLRRVITVLLAGAALASPVRGQEEKPITLPANGPDFFSHILHSEHLTALTSFKQAQDDPHDCVIIILGNPHEKNVLRFTNGELNPFLKKGGTLLIATDHELSLTNSLGIKVTGRRVEKPAEMGYHRNGFCPMLDYSMPLADEPITPKTIVRRAREHPVFSLLQMGIATNCPSHIEINHPPQLGVSRLLNFPLEGGGLRGETPTYVAGSPKDAPPEGRFLVVAGYGTFMNSMMLQKDNDNFAFAINCVRWLREKSDGTKRRHALFVVDGEIISKFDRNLTPPPPPIPMPPVTVINRLLRGLEDEGFFHRAFATILGDSYEHVVPFVIPLATCVLLLYGSKKFLEGRHWRDTTVPRMIGSQSSVAEAPPRGAQRQRALFRGSNLREEGRALVEQWLQSVFGVTPEDWAAAGGAAAFRAAGVLGSGWLMRRRADRVLDLLRVAGPTKASRRDLALLIESLPDLSRAAQEGRLTLLLDGKEVRQKSTR